MLQIHIIAEVSLQHFEIDARWPACHNPPQNLSELRSRGAHLRKFKTLRTIIFRIPIVVPIMVTVGLASKSTTQSLNLEGLFPESYHDSRTKFLNKVSELQSAGVELVSYSQKVPSNIHDDLYIDLAYLPPSRETERLIILTSGVHGVEAPLGHALEIAFLDRVLPTLKREKVGVLILHNMNPYGFLNVRRQTEKNADLNRNFLNPSAKYDIENKMYELNKGWMNPEKKLKHPNTSSFALSFNFLYRFLFGIYSQRDLTHGMAGGQYSNEKGTYYGGRDPEFQVAWLTDVFEKYASNYSELLYWDFHTGLGKRAQLQLITSTHTSQEDPRVAPLLMNLKKNSKVSVVTEDTKGFFATSGAIVDYLHDWAFQRGIKTIAFTPEFGTLGTSIPKKLGTSARILLENRGEHNGYASPEVKALVKKRYQELFNPSDSKWRKSVMETGVWAMQEHFKAFENQPALIFSNPIAVNE